MFRVCANIRKTASSGKPIDGYTKQVFWYCNELGGLQRHKKNADKLTQGEAERIAAAYRLLPHKYANVTIVG